MTTDENTIVTVTVRTKDLPALIELAQGKLLIYSKQTFAVICICAISIGFILGMFAEAIFGIVSK